MAKQAAAGNKYTFIGFLDSDNYLIGGTPTAPASAAASGMHRVLGIKAAPINVPDVETVQATGDDGLIAEFEFDSIEPRTYIMTASVDDLVLLSNLLGTTVTSFLGGNMTALDVNDAPERNVCVIHQSRAKYQDSGIAGQKAWQAYIINVATAKYLGRDGFDERGVATYRISVTPQLSTNHFYGVTLLNSVGTDAARIIPVQLPYPVHAIAVTGDGAETTYDLDFTPVSTAYTAAWQFRTSVGVNSVSTANQTVTFSSAPTGRSIVAYGFEG